jgi:hypothetical protein
MMDYMDWLEASGYFAEPVEEDEDEEEGTNEDEQ